MKIVSANPRPIENRNSLVRQIWAFLRPPPFKPWLIRWETQTINQATPAYIIEATEVTFGPAPTPQEVGFGESMVAYCKTAVIYSEPFTRVKGLTPIEFIDGCFRDIGNAEVTWCERVIFYPDGHMDAAPVDEKPEWAK